MKCFSRVLFHRLRRLNPRASDFGPLAAAGIDALEDTSVVEKHARYEMFAVLGLTNLNWFRWHEFKILDLDAKVNVELAT